MAAAIAEFLDAAGIDRDGPHLADTPARVTAAWADEILAGYAADPAAILADSTPAESDGLVVMTGISFVSTCPHHLLPYNGVAHLAYRPGERVAGFGRLVELVQALGARLVIQEDLARDICAAIVEHLGAAGAGCVLEAKQQCMAVRGVRQHDTRVRCTAWTGDFDENSDARRSLLDAVAAWRPHEGAPA